MTESITSRKELRADILAAAKAVFGRAEYSAVSMDDIAKEAGVERSLLEEYYPVKGGLYADAVKHAFQEKALLIGKALAKDGTPAARLEYLVYAMVRVAAEDPDFRKLYQREMLNGNKARLKILAEDVFSEQFSAVAWLAHALAPDCDAHMFVISAVGLVIHHFETADIRPFYPGYRRDHDDLRYISEHITHLLLHGVNGLVMPGLAISAASHRGQKKRGARTQTP
jgi:AcrR family transcriptional regulator